MPATNKRVTFTGITINQIAAGKILESTVIWDGLGLMKQFGIDLPIQYEMLSLAADWRWTSSARSYPQLALS